IIDLLFRFIQYIERQVVLFDAVEDASFNKLNITDEQSSLRALFLKANDDKNLHEKVDQLIEDFSSLFPSEMAGIQSLNLLSASTILWETSFLVWSV
ncbi:MAG: hypothetical protein EOP53_16660, partial [Sphingobacteriales bacterium]